nr:E3 ubiquitin-protein ligase SHPRH-like [Nicotiana tomentosiformis]XP_009611462.1 E3 ubiquitin-protein ligase SHPRH-like [Nicotiana tomentosiformis]
MGRRKSKPNRSVGILEGEVPNGQSNGKNDAETAKKDVSFEVDVPFFVEIDRSNWLSDEHMDISEIVLSDLNVSEEFCHYVLDEEFYRDSRYILRFRVSNVDEYLNRIKLGHWPVFPASSICLEIVVKKEKEGLEENVVLVEGNFDGPDEGISGLVHLASLKFLTLRPVTGHIVPSCLASIRLRVEILRSAFDACESLLDTSRQLWKKSMMHVMAWLRPEVVTSEARYGYEVAAHSDVGLASGLAESSASRKCSRFDVASFYEAIKPSKEEPMLDDNLPGLLPKLRPYQRRAAYWMVQREKRNFDGSLQSKINRFISPLCMQLSLIETSMTIYYNPFCGNVSLHAEIAPPVVPGGILAGKRNDRSSLIHHFILLLSIL